MTITSFQNNRKKKTNDITESERKRGKVETVGNRTKGYRKTIGYEVNKQRETNVDKC